MGGVGEMGGGAATHRRVFCLDLFGMFRFFETISFCYSVLNCFWLCVDLFWKV